jgi:hypothetical protein
MFKKLRVFSTIVIILLLLINTNIANAKRTPENSITKPISFQRMVDDDLGGEGVHFFKNAEIIIESPNTELGDILYVSLKLKDESYNKVYTRHKNTKVPTYKTNKIAGESWISLGGKGDPVKIEVELLGGKNERDYILNPAWDGLYRPEKDLVWDWKKKGINAAIWVVEEIPYVGGILDIGKGILPESQVKKTNACKTCKIPERMKDKYWLTNKVTYSFDHSYLYTSKGKSRDYYVTQTIIGHSKSKKARKARITVTIPVFDQYGKVNTQAIPSVYTFDFEYRKAEK